MNNSIFLPKKIRVGFQNRDDTYTGKLAYVIYYDANGKIRKETSWESWRDKTIEPQEFDNVPTEGFVLNKKVGGYRYEWNPRQTYVRVYDPRGFEFEITIPNLLHILENTSSIKGKGLEGKFVYGWDGKELVLLSTASTDYEKLTQLNEKRFNPDKLKASDLKIGYKYLSKGNKELVYMGRFEAYDNVYHFDGKQFQTIGALERYAREQEKPLFSKVESFRYKYNVYGGSRDNALYEYSPGCIGLRYFFACEEEWKGFKLLKSVSGQIIDILSDQVVPEYVNLLEKLESSTSYSPYDPSKDVIGRDEIKLSSSGIAVYGGQRYLTLVNDELVEYIVYNHYNSKGENEGCTCTFTENRKYGMAPYFPHKTDMWGTQMIPISIEQIFEKLPPYYVDQYLQNGKLWRRIRNYYGY